MEKLFNHVCVMPTFLLSYYTIPLSPIQESVSGILMHMNIYFTGIGGVGLGPLAEIAHDMGHTVVGTDIVDGLVTEELSARGITVNIGQDGSFLRSYHADQPIDWLVYTAGIPDTHPELVVATELGINVSKRDELLAHLLEEKGLELIAVAGTHGKTTTTGMLVWALQQANVPVSYSIGTTISFGPSGQYVEGSRYFVYECDEFDRNFLHFAPHLSLITSFDYDHPDTYPTEPEYVQAFRQFIDQSGHTILWRGDAERMELGQSDHRWILPEEADTYPMTLAGEHTRRNASLVVKAFEYLDLGLAADTIDALNHFPGTNRRFERLADNLYTDYGHHPVEIAATLQLAREISDRVVLVYQPHQNSRQHEIKDDYHDQFERAEHVFWLPTYLSREDPDLDILKPETLIQNLTNKSSVEVSELDETLWEAIEAARADGALVLCMGAGSIDGWVRRRLAV